MGDGTKNRRFELEQPGRECDPWLRKIEDRFITGIAITIPIVIGFYLLTAVIYLIVNCSPGQIPGQALMLLKHTMETAGKNWPVLLILLVPLFYRSARRAAENLTGKFLIKPPVRSGEKLQGGSPVEETQPEPPKDAQPEGQEE